MNAQVAEWLRSHHTGASSLTIVAFMEGPTTPLGSAVIGIGRFSHPHDVGDLGRCIRLLSIAPEYKARLPEMAQVSPVWAQLVTHWDELEALYRKHTFTAAGCYERMKELIAAGRASVTE